MSRFEGWEGKGREVWSQMDVGGQINEIATYRLFISIRKQPLSVWSWSGRNRNDWPVNWLLWPLTNTDKGTVGFG
jgi:hypothetical protein